MTTDTSIKPALTPEEWRRWRNHNADGRAGMLSFVTMYRNYPAVIALANDALSDDDPCKITWYDVEECLFVAREWEARADGSLEWSQREFQYEWERRAAKLAALLPPR